jgi:hypothetical protein
MRSLRRRLPRRDRVADRFVLEDVDAPEPGPDPAALLRRIAFEAVLLQDEAEAVLGDIHARQPLGLIAPRAGPLARRFFTLRDELPTRTDEPAQARLREELAAILHAHAMSLTVAMDFLAHEWRSPALARQLDGLTDLGAPARRLDEICTGLAGLTLDRS